MQNNSSFLSLFLEFLIPFILYTTSFLLGMHDTFIRLIFSPIGFSLWRHLLDVDLPTIFSFFGDIVYAADAPVEEVVNQNLPQQGSQHLPISQPERLSQVSYATTQYSEGLSQGSNATSYSSADEVLPLSQVSNSSGDESLPLSQASNAASYSSADEALPLSQESNGSQ